MNREFSTLTKYVFPTSCRRFFLGVTFHSLLMKQGDLRLDSLESER